MQRLSLWHARISTFFLPHSEGLQSPRATPPHSLPSLGLGQQRAFFSISAQLWHPEEESLYSHPFLRLALWMIPPDEAVCVSWWFWDCVCFDFFFSVCIFPRQIETKFPPL